MKTERLGQNYMVLLFADGLRVLISYETLAAAYVPGKGYLRSSRFVSRATSRHTLQFINGAPFTIVPACDIVSLIEGR